MRFKIKLFSLQVWQLFGRIATWTLAIFSIAVIFCPVDDIKWWLLGGLLVLHLAIYLGCWIYCNKIKTVKLTVGDNKVIIKEGNLFEEKGQKVIPFNERFDTDVDDIVIAKGSLNGIFITKYCDDSTKLDSIIENYMSHKSPSPIIAIDQQMHSRKKIIYKLGTIMPYNDFYLLAYSHFDDNNRAFLQKNDIVELYIRMWNEIDIIKAQNSIVMPVLGSSRLVRNLDLTPQQLIELILWTLRVSKVRLERRATLTIVVHSSMINDIDLLDLKSYSD